MKRFNFGPIYINYVSTILNGTEASVKNAGWLSSWFGTSRGVRQGCCLSPLLFILVVECLAIKIRNNVNIANMTYEDNDVNEKTKILQYADDISLFLKSINSLTLTLKEIDSFRTISGLVLNRKKSIGMWLGTDRGRPPGGEGIRWLDENENIKVLGIYFNASTEASLIELNWTIKIEEVKQVITQWSRRNISLWGKSIIVKTFILSKLNYILQSLRLPDHVLKLIDSLIFKFLWKKGSNKSGQERIKRTTLCLNVAEGGISMISILDQQLVMLLQWFFKINRNVTCLHFSLVNRLLKDVGGLEYVLNSNTKLADFRGLSTIKSYYWQKAISAWLEFDKSLLSIDNDTCKTIFNNKNILHHNKPMLISRWLNTGFKYLNQLVINGTLKTYEEVKTEVGAYGGLLLDYMAVHKAVNKSGINLLLITPTLSNIILPALPNKVLRRIIASERSTSLNCTNYWLRKMQIDISKYFCNGVASTKESRLRLLHFNIIHNTYPTNFLLKKMRIKESDKCDFCQEQDFLDHFFFECGRLREFWNDIELHVGLILKHNLKINAVIALLGITKDDTTANLKRMKEANHLLLIAKMCISVLRNAEINNIKYIFKFHMNLRKKHFLSLESQSLID